MTRFPSRGAFTLIEMITVMAIIAILAGLVLSVNSYVQRKSSMARAQAEIQSMLLGAENYKTDNAAYPRSDDTDKFDPRANGAPATDPQLTKYMTACQVLYIALSGDTKLDFHPTETVYAKDFFQPQRIHFDNVNSASRKVQYIQDPFGNCYGYSTLGAKAEEDFREVLRTSKDPTKEKRQTDKGFNSTFDLWSTGGSNVSSPTDLDRAKWIKNW